MRISDWSSDGCSSGLRKRIAAGSGMTPADVNKLMKQYQQMEKLMGKLGRGGMKGMMRGMKGMMGGMGGGGKPVRRTRHGPGDHRGQARARHPLQRPPRRGRRPGRAGDANPRPETRRDGGAVREET